jgi:hypothetical protein
MDLPSFDVVVRPLGYGVLLPAALTAAGLLLAARPALAARGGDILAVAIGLVAGFAALAGSGEIVANFLKPSSTWDWLPAVALLANALGIADRLILEPGLASAKSSKQLWRSLRWGTRLGIGLLAGWLLMRAQSALEPVSGGWIAALAVTATGLWALDFVARSWPGSVLPMLLTLVAFAAAALMHLCGFITLAMMGGVLGAVLAACTVVGWLRPHAAVTRGAVPALAVLLPGLLFCSHFNDYSETPAACHLLIVAAPLVLLVTSIPPVARLSSGWLALLRVAVVLLPLAAALTIAALA